MRAPHKMYESDNELATPRVVIHPEALKTMRERGGRWAAYQNHALDHVDVGRLQFLQYGPECTFKKPPERAPDTASCGMGWRYLHVGFVDLTTGDVVQEEP